MIFIKVHPISAIRIWGFALMQRKLLELLLSILFYDQVGVLPISTIRILAHEPELGGLVAK
jgi:hypothetical protein